MECVSWHYCFDIILHMLAYTSENLLKRTSINSAVFFNNGMLLIIIINIVYNYINCNDLKGKLLLQ